MQSGLRAVTHECEEEAHQEWLLRLGHPEEGTLAKEWTAVGVVRGVTLVSVVSIGKKVTHSDLLLQWLATRG